MRRRRSHRTAMAVSAASVLALSLVPTAAYAVENASGQAFASQLAASGMDATGLWIAGGIAAAVLVVGGLLLWRSRRGQGGDGEA